VIEITSAIILYRLFWRFESHNIAKALKLNQKPGWTFYPENTNHVSVNDFRIRSCY